MCGLRCWMFIFCCFFCLFVFFFFQAEDGIRDIGVTGVQTCALPICVLDSIGCSGIPRGDGVQNLWGGWDDWQVPEVFTKCSLSLAVFGQYTYLQASDFILVISQQFNIHYRVIASLPVNTTSCSYIITRIKGSMQLGSKWISVTLKWKCT